MRLICLFVLIFLSISSPVKSQDNITLDYPTKVIYQSMIGCYQGTHRWIVLSNPALIGITPPQQAQEKMTIHCFCVMDRVRSQLTFAEYMIKVYDLDYMAKVWMANALLCVKENGTLEGIIVFDDSTDNETKLILPSAQLDNSTDNTTVIPEKNDDIEEKNEGEPETIFQG